MFSDRTRNYGQYALLALRIAVGVFFVFHGLSKIGIINTGGFGRAVGFFAELQMPAPGITAPLLAVVETLGGLALIFGVLARVVAILLTLIVAAEIMLVKLPQSINPISYSFELSLFAALLVLAYFGPGALALDEETQSDKPPFVSPPGRSK
ncbi:MAG: DoxX family protein [Chloroflexia bacterium]